MARRPKTGFDTYLAGQMKEPGFARAYESARSEIDSVDTFVRALDARREQAGLTKSHLAKLVGMKPEVVRRLFTSSEANPTLETVIRIAVALDCKLGLEPRRGGKALRRPSARGSRLIQATDRGRRFRNSSPSKRTLT
ncbi:MAG: helix-turn-helix domain-containing protein [Myxococcaceae bacterium]